MAKSQKHGDREAHKPKQAKVAAHVAGAAQTFETLRKAQEAARPSKRA